MQFGQVDVEGAHGVQHQRRQQTGAVGTLQMIEGTAATIIVEEGGLARLQAQVFGYPARSPSGQGIEGLTRQQQVGHQEREGDGGGQGRLSTRQGWQVLLEQLR